MANVLWYYSSIHDLGCGCCQECVVEWELCDESGEVLECSDNGPVVYDSTGLKESFAYLVERYGEFEAHPYNVYL